MSVDFNKLREVRALVIGDCMLDRYIVGTVSRISPEAPVPVISVTDRYETLGGAANVAAGLASLGVLVSLAGTVGSDEDGKRLFALAQESGIDVADLRSTLTSTTICKTRLIAGRRHQLLRLDVDGSKLELESEAVTLLESLQERIGRFGIVVIADYDKGNAPQGAIARLLQRCKTLKIPTIVDPKKTDFSAYANAYIVTPNRGELERAVGRQLLSQEAIVTAARELMARHQITYLLCTCGEDGMVLVADAEMFHIPADVRRVADVAGAGDTVVAILSACFGAGWPIIDACRCAAVGAGIAVSHPFVHVVTRSELQRGLQGQSLKNLSAEEAVLRIRRLREAGLRIVFTNGCFDILHAGHLACLSRARSLGDFLVVGLNSDDSVRRLKGESRPRIKQDHRAAVLAGLECVDMVVIFPEDTPEMLLDGLRPDVLVKGGDYDVSQVVGASFVKAYGGDVIVLPLVEGLSTTRILAQSTSSTVTPISSQVFLSAQEAGDQNEPQSPDAAGLE